MKSIPFAMALAVLGTALWFGAAQARNPHCAGGIQYVVQGLRDKDKGNLEDYQREMQKAVQQLEMCSTEDPQDFEALGYLGWAYAEVDSTRLAGPAFEKAITGLAPKDPKKADIVRTNREAYWVIKFNNGINAINSAREAYPDFLKQPENDADRTLREQAAKRYDEATTQLLQAAQLKPGDPRTLRNLGSVYAYRGEYPRAEEYFQEGLKAAPGDTALLQSLAQVRMGRAGSLIDEKQYDQAIAYYEDLIAKDAQNSDLFLGLAEAHFKKAQSLEGDARKPEFKKAADAYAKAGALKPDNADLPFNAALAYQNAGEPALAEAQWRASLKLRPNDADAMSALGSTLADQKKYAEAVQILRQAIDQDPKNKTLHRQLGAVYTKAGNNAKATEELMVYLSMQNGKPVDDPAAQAKKAPAGSAAAKLLASAGPPDQVNPWEADGKKYETWYYWTKKAAYHFDAQGNQLHKSDWSVASNTVGSK